VEQSGQSSWGSGGSLDSTDMEIEVPGLISEQVTRGIIGDYFASFMDGEIEFLLRDVRATVESKQ